MHLYNLDFEKCQWIIDSFAVLRKYEEIDHGEFRTRRLTLTAYEAMAEAKKLGTTYKSPLNPPPADPNLCHSNSVAKSVEL